MSAPAASPGSGPPALPPTSIPPVSTPPVAAPPVATPPLATPPVATPPTIAPPPVATPPVAAPPVAAPPPVETPPPIAPPPPIATPPPPIATPPPVGPPPVASPPPADAPPPIATNPPALPPADAPPPPIATPPVSPPAASPPAPSPPTPVSIPPAASPPNQPLSPPPPADSPPPNSPPPPRADSPPPDSPPPPGTPLVPPPPPFSPPPPGTPPASPPPPRLISPPAPVAGRPPPSSQSGNDEGTGSSGTGGISTAAVAGIAVGGVLAVILVAVVWFFLAKRKPKQELNYAHHVGRPGSGGLGGSNGSDGFPSYGARMGYLDSQEFKTSSLPGYSGTIGGPGKKPIPPPPDGNSSAGSTRPWFTYHELEAATNGFSQENVLGEGGFGRVYKGTIAGNQLVAVKQLTIGGGQGEREFRAEVEIISRVHHRHLVSLVGYCIADSQRLLVYDFVPNGTLEHALHGKGRPIMDWGTRMKIALGSARGLAYLHEDCHPRIIHRDIKASNILLDNQWEAQVADFGLAKLSNDTHTHVTTRVMGTFGYLAPEYALSGKLTDKSDVYSFGVVLLELITGKKPVDAMAAAGEESLVEWARPFLTQALEDGVLDHLADANLKDMYNEKEMLRTVEVAAACVRHSAQKRPKMALVVRALETEGTDLNQGLKPGYSTVYGSGESTEFDSSQYKANLAKFRQVAYGSSQQYSSDYSSGNTSEYAMPQQSASSGEHGTNGSREHHSRERQHPDIQEYGSSGDRSSDEVRLDVADQTSPFGDAGLSRFAPPSSLPLPPARRPVAGFSVRSPQGGGGQRPGHNRRGSDSTPDFTGASSVQAPDYIQPYSGEYPDSKYSTEDEGSKGSRPLLSTHKTKTVKFDFDQ